MSEQVPTADKVVFTAGTAVNRDELTAFDAALQDAGIHNVNIVKISSIIPPEATVYTDWSASQLADHIHPGGCYHTVLSRETTNSPGERIYSAIGGCLLESGYGLNVELHGSEETEKEVRGRCRSMLREMADRRDETIDSDIWCVFEATEKSPGEEFASTVAAAVYL